MCPATDLLGRAAKKYREDGGLVLLGRGLQYVGKRITERAKGADFDPDPWYGTLTNPGLRRRKSAIQDSFTSDPRYLNVGGGRFAKPHWRVLDHASASYDYSSVFVDVDVDLERRETWPVDDGSIDLVYSSHTLEHLSDATVEHVLAESYRVLKPGGGIRITVPDIDLAIEWYERGDVDWFVDIARREPLSQFEAVADGYLPEAYLIDFFATHLVEKPRSAAFPSADLDEVRKGWRTLDKPAFLNAYTERIQDEWQAEDPALHRNWFDVEKLRALLADSGFEDVEESTSRRSRFRELCEPEFDTRPHMSLYVEGVKPGAQ